MAKIEQIENFMFKNKLKNFLKNIIFHSLALVFITVLYFLQIQ